MSDDESGSSAAKFQIPVLDMDDNPVKVDNNKAKFLGVLDAATEYFHRTGQHEELVTNGTVVLKTGKTAVESLDHLELILNPVREENVYGYDRLRRCNPD